MPFAFTPLSPPPQSHSTQSSGKTSTNPAEKSSRAARRPHTSDQTTPLCESDKDTSNNNYYPYYAQNSPPPSQKSRSWTPSSSNTPHQNTTALPPEANQDTPPQTPQTPSTRTQAPSSSYVPPAPPHPTHPGKSTTADTNRKSAEAQSRPCKNASRNA